MRQVREQMTPLTPPLNRVTSIPSFSRKDEEILYFITYQLWGTVTIATEKVKSFCSFLCRDCSCQLVFENRRCVELLKMGFEVTEAVLEVHMLHWIIVFICFQCIVTNTRI